MRWLATTASLLLLIGATTADPLPANTPIHLAVDHFINELLAQEDITPADQADDATLIRRLTLDLTGRIPTLAEVNAYTSSKNPNKREELIDRLIASPAFARFQAQQFDAMLNAGSSNNRGSVRDYLALALKEGQTWEAIFRGLMLPDPANPKHQGAAEYLRSRVADLDRLTAEVSSAFFGVNISCAQCHDHPLVADWKQDHFYGLKSFFSRTYEVNGLLGEREAGIVKFKPTKGPERSAKLMFLTGAVVDTSTLRDLNKDEQKREKEAADKAKSTKTPIPPPAFSARAKLVEVALRSGPEREYFAKNLVNRLWYRLFGYGLVNPLDQMHSENAPSHPELLQWLAHDTIAHQYSIPRLMKGLAMSQAYSRSSQYPSAAQPAPKYFAVARLKPLTPAQLGTSLKLATTDQTAWAKLKPVELEQRLVQLESSGRGLVGQLPYPTEDFQIGVNEALLFSNGERIQKELLADSPGTLLAQVAKLDAAAATEAMMHAVLGRSPTPPEQAALVEYFAKRTDRQPEALKQVLWALLTSPEFRFCY